MHGLDDLGAVDATQVSRGDRKVRVPELALMTISEIPSRDISTACAWRSWCGANRRRTPAAMAASCSCLRIPAGAHGRPRVGPRTTQNSLPTGRPLRSSSHGMRCDHPQRSIPTSRRLSPLPWRTSRAPRSGSRSVSLSASASLIRSPARHSATITPRSRTPSALSPAARITATISSTVGGSAGYRRPLLPGDTPWWRSMSSPETGAVRRDPAPLWIP
jgi:hypothetical protein